MSLSESLKSALGAFLNAFGISKPQDVEKKPDWRSKAAAQAAAEASRAKSEDAPH
jgi:hypothetical protein